MSVPKSYKFSAINAQSDVKWCVTGIGVSIDNKGVVTLDRNVCGAITVTAESCGRRATKTVRVENVYYCGITCSSSCSNRGCDSTQVSSNYSLVGENVKLWYGYEDKELWGFWGVHCVIGEPAIQYDPYCGADISISGKDCPEIYKSIFGVQLGAVGTCDSFGSGGTLINSFLYIYDFGCREGEPKEQCASTDTCEVDISVSPSGVAPKKTVGNTQAEVSLTLKKPAPPGGCTVDLKAYPVPNSGGHDHNDAVRPVGTISQPSITFSQGETEPKTATYTSSEVAGTETITATVKGKEVAKANINVKVPGLMSLGGGGNLRLTGQTNAHKANHYGTYYAVTNARLVAEDYYEQFGATLGINDMSLPLGGMFDIGPPQGSFWNPPHRSHRKGTSVDIDRCAKSAITDNPNPRGTCSNGWIKVDKRYIELKCWGHGKGNLAIEPQIHCEYPNVR